MRVRDELIAGGRVFWFHIKRRKGSDTCTTFTMFNDGASMDNRLIDSLMQRMPADAALPTVFCVEWPCWGQQEEAHLVLAFLVSAKYCGSLA